MPDEAQKFLELLRAEFQCYLEETRGEEERRVREQQHLRLYSLISVVSGTFLATASLSLCAFAIEKGANLVPLAAVLGPVAGIAGVFIWGYQTKALSGPTTSKKPSSAALTRGKVKVDSPTS